MNTKRDYTEGYFFEEQHIYTVEAWGALAGDLSDSVGDEQDHMTVARLVRLED